jgi:hypothetical protein
MMHSGAGCPSPATLPGTRADPRYLRTEQKRMGHGFALDVSTSGTVAALGAPTRVGD